MPGLFDGAFSGGGLLPYDDPRLARALMPTGNFVEIRSPQPPCGRDNRCSRPPGARKELSPLCCRTICRMWRK